MAKEAKKPRAPARNSRELKGASAPRPARRRRTPEEARGEILAAAERLFALRGPDAVTIQQVAREAGVSHPLVVHYFHSYEALVREVLRGRNQQLRDALVGRIAAAGPQLEAQALLSLLLDALSDPSHARLLAWAALSGEADKLPLVRNKAASKIADMLEMRLRAGAIEGAPPTREALDQAILLGASAVLGYATFRSILVPGLGMPLGAASDRQFEGLLRELLRRHLTSKDP